MIRFLQKIGKSLVIAIATLPIAGILLRLGQDDIIAATSGAPFISNILPYFKAAGSALLDNLPLLFAIGVATGLSNDQNGASGLAGAVSYLTLTNICNSYWTSKFTEEVSSKLSISFLGGILAGIVGGICYNKFRKVRPPEFLAFFGGRRLVPIMSGLISLVIGIPLAFIWPYIQNGISSFSVYVAGLGAVGAGLFGMVNRLLLPVGLHHVLNSFFWFQLGNYNGVFGDLNRFFAGDPTAGTFMAGFYPIMMFGLPAVALAIIYCAKKGKRKAVSGMLISLALTSFLTGVTEPIEFLFILLSPWLLFAHAILTGVSMFITETLGVLHGFTFSAGFIDYVMNFNLATKPWLIIPIGFVMAVLYFFVFTFLIKHFNLPTPGREDDNAIIGTNPVDGKKDEDGSGLYKEYIISLGGSDNIVTIDNCATRLRLELNDASKIDEAKLKELGAKGVIKLDNKRVQVVIGTTVEFVKDGIVENMEQGNNDGMEP